MDRDQSSMSAPTSLIPSKLTSAPISGLVLIKATAPNLEKSPDLPLPDYQQTANTDHHKIQLSALRKIAQSETKLPDVSITGDVINRSRGDKPVINGQLASLINLRNAVEEERKCRPLKKLKWEGEEEGGESECVTPTAREQRIPQEILICPLPPCKKRHCKRKNTGYAMAPSSSSPPQYAHLLAAEQAHGAPLQLVVKPPDLHTFPECIRSLFFPDQ